MSETRPYVLRVTTDTEHVRMTIRTFGGSVYTSRHDGRELISIAETARKLDIGRSKTYGLLGEGELESVRIGGRRLVVVESINNLIERLRQQERERAERERLRTAARDQ
jgi:excisionase family DNA binding protein